MDLSLHIPAEILIGIFTHLTPGDIKSTRLVCHRFEALGTPLLIKTAYFAARVNALEKFLKIANHPVFSQTVRTVIYQGAFYREELTQREAFDHEEEQVRDMKNDEGAADEVSTRCFERYCSLFEHQRRLMDSGSALAGLTHGLQKMAKVENIVFTDLWDGDDRYGYYKSDRCDGMKPELYPSGWDRTDRLSDFDGLSYIIRAASVSRRQIANLEVNCSFLVKRDPESTPCSAFRLSPQDLQHGWQAFRGLTSITLEIGHRGFESRNGDLEGLFYMLSGAEHLHTLFLETKHCALLTPVLVRERFWPRLRKLTFYFIMCEYNFIEAILWNQRSTLSEFNLCFSFIFGGSKDCDESVLARYAEEYLTLDRLAVERCDFYAS